MQIWFYSQELVIIHPIIYMNYYMRIESLVDELDKVMSIFSVEDWPYFQRFREAAKFRYGSNPKLLEIIEDVRQTIRDKGPVTSDDLEYKQSVALVLGTHKVISCGFREYVFLGRTNYREKNKRKKSLRFC